VSAVSAWSRFGAWAERTVPAADVRRLRLAFACVWLAYDVLDVALGGTARTWAPAPELVPRELLPLQLGLIASEVAMLTERGATSGALAAMALRALEATLLPLNDFLYFIVTAALLASARARNGEVPRWTVVALQRQAAWIYLATSVLKMSPDFLSGGHFWVRHQHLIMSGRTFPELYARCATTLPCNAALAWGAVSAELALALLLLGRAPWWLVTALAAGIHGFAALTMNVTFFGVAMVVHVAFSSRALERS